MRYSPSFVKRLGDLIRGNFTAVRQNILLPLRSRGSRYSHDTTPHSDKGANLDGGDFLIACLCNEAVVRRAPKLSSDRKLWGWTLTFAAVMCERYATICSGGSPTDPSCQPSLHSSTWLSGLTKSKTLSTSAPEQQHRKHWRQAAVARHSSQASANTFVSKKRPSSRPKEFRHIVAFEVIGFLLPLCTQVCFEALINSLVVSRIDLLVRLSSLGCSGTWYRQRVWVERLLCVMAASCLLALRSFDAA